MMIISAASHQVTRNHCNSPDVSERGLTAEGVDVDGEVARMVKTHAKRCVSLRNDAAKNQTKPVLLLCKCFMSAVAGPEGVCCIVAEFCGGSSNSDVVLVLVQSFVRLRRESLCLPAAIADTKLIDPAG